jgi:hypothetical protein
MRGLVRLLGRFVELLARARTPTGEYEGRRLVPLIYQRPEVGRRQATGMVLAAVAALAGLVVTAWVATDLTRYARSDLCPPPVTTDRSCHYLVAGVVTDAAVAGDGHLSHDVVVRLSTEDTVDTGIPSGDDTPGVGEPVTVTMWGGEVYDLRWHGQTYQAGAESLGVILIAFNGVVGWPGLGVLLHIATQTVTRVDVGGGWSFLLWMAGSLSTLALLAGVWWWLATVVAVIAVGVFGVTVLGPIRAWREQILDDQRS